ncbi:hypothetical protein AB837_00366 [bacterium AB1]|nr:hypothetical protein AB837_00366 [bacterium AB1]
MKSLRQMCSLTLTLLIIDMLTSGVHFAILGLISGMLYTDCSLGGMGKLGYATISETGDFRANVNLLATCLAFFCGLFSVFVNNTIYLIFIGTLLSVLQPILLLICGSNKLIYSAVILIGYIRLMFLSVGLMRMLTDIADQSDVEDIKKNIYIYYYLFMNIGVIVCKFVSGYLRQHVNLQYSILSLVCFNVISLFLCFYVVYNRKKLGEQKSAISIKDVYYDVIALDKRKLFGSLLFLGNSLLLILLFMEGVHGFNSFINILIVSSCLFYILIHFIGLYVQSIIITMTLISYKVYKVVANFEDMPLMPWLLKHTNLNFYGFNIPGEWIVLINSFMVITCTILIYEIVHFISRKVTNNLFLQMAMGSFIGLISVYFFALMEYEYKLYGISSIVGPIGYIFFMTFGEIFNAPNETKAKARVLKSKYYGLVSCTNTLLGAVGIKIVTNIPHEAYSAMSMYPIIRLATILTIVLIVMLIVFSYYIRDSKLLTERDTVSKSKK